ncbi:MAG: hypothetical protein II567_09385 [Candidatus Riflebacteria bacterium]|nr:hypothetical protein [Candidatus Riflebacteria bacterium]
MINKDKLLILATVPVAMIINLSLLNICFGNKEGYKETTVSKSEITKTQNTNTSVQPKTSINYTQSRNKLKISHFPDPPIHTFAGNETQEMNEDEEKIKAKGVIIN